MIHWPAKEVVEELDYLFQFGAALESGETIATKAVTVSGVTLDDDDIIGGDVQVWLSGGIAGTVARVTCDITTSSTPPRLFSEVAILPIGGGPVSLACAKAWLKIEAEETDEDGLVAMCLRMAVDQVERLSGRYLTPRVAVQRAKRFAADWGGPLRLFKGPVREIVSVFYRDGDGAPTELEDYVLIDGEQGMLLPAIGETWPATYELPDAVTVEALTGYEAGELPATLEAATLTATAHLHANRGDFGSDWPEVERRIRSLLSSYMGPGIG